MKHFVSSGLLVAPLLQACDPVQTIDITVVVPAETQAALDLDSAHWELVVEADTFLSGGQIGVICEAGEEIRYEDSYSQIGCAEQGTATAWLAPVPLTSDTGEQPACGMSGSSILPDPVNATPPDDAIVVSEDYFVEESGDCKASYTHDVVLTLTAS